MEFTNQEKRAILKVLADIMTADGILDVNEKAYFAAVYNALNATKNDLSEMLSMKVSESLAILKTMEQEKKLALGIMMQQMIEADNDIDEKELNIFMVVFESIGIILPDDIK